MTSKRKDFFEAQGYRNINKRIFVSLLIFVGVGLIYGIYFLFFSVSVCLNSECFFDAVESCEKVSWVKDDLKADWYYEIIGDSGDECNIKVKLLNINEGSVENKVLEGKSMVCKFSGEGEFPEDNVFSCSGPLREEIQEKIIRNMHNYLLENIGKIGKGFEGV